MVTMQDTVKKNTLSTICFQILLQLIIQDATQIKLSYKNNTFIYIL